MSQFPSVIVPPRLPLVVSTANRDSNTHKDAKLVNCYLETSKVEQGRLWIYNRPGIQTYDTVSESAAAGAGLFNWAGDIYSIFGNTLYKNGIQVATGLDTTNGVYSFSSILGAVPKMVLGNGAKAYAYSTTGGLTADLHSIDEDFPATFVKGIAYIQGGTYVMNPKAVIWGSAINSVSESDSWDPLDFISAQLEPDNGVYLAKQLVYIVAFNEWSTEVFFYAGNPVGSPLGSNQGAKLDYGCKNADSVQAIDTRLIWLSWTKAGALQFAMMEGLNTAIISTASIDRLLEAVDATSVYSWQAKMYGHSFYVVTFPNSNLTLCFDLSEGLWHQWTDVNGNYLPFVASVATNTGTVLLQHASDGKLYEMSPSLYNDDGAIITADIVTPNFDAGTRRRKQLNMMTFIADQNAGSTLLVRKSDDDYETWSVFRSVDLSRKLPQLPNCGTFTKRAWHFRHQSNTPMRIEAVEVQYDLGTL